MSLFKNKISLFIVGLIFNCLTVFAQQDNLLPIELWTKGDGSIPVEFYAMSGSTVHNKRIIASNPHKENVVIWQAANRQGGDNTFNINGGFRTNTSSQLDNTLSYRYSVWVKSMDISCGKIYFGTRNTQPGSEVVTNLADGSPNKNPYFWSGLLPETEKWYLLVGYIYKFGYDGSNEIQGGVYDGETGQKLTEGAGSINLRDFVQVEGSINAYMRSFFWGCNDVDDDSIKHQFWAPRIEVINGNEPTIGSLLGKGTGSNFSSSWTEVNANNNTNINFDQDGAVGVNIDINSATPFDANFKFLVNGDIKTQRVKVTPDGWADFVFADDYDLPTLKSVEDFISKNKHLPEIPSEKEVLEQGVYIDEIDAKLLQKVEELTLYLIQQEKRINSLETTNEELVEKVKALTTQLSKD